MTTPIESASRCSPLHDEHVAAGAKFADFGGWRMPLEYAGVVAEHTAVREAAGIFDVSHLGKAVVSGPGAAEFLNRCLTADLAKIGPGQAQYTLLATAEGGVVDDLIAYLRSADEVFLMPNAANAAQVLRLLRAAAPDGIEIIDRHHEAVVLAVQGPRSDEILAAVGLPTEHDYLSWVDAERAGLPLLVCRTGYTGERGYELIADVAGAAELWRAILGAGQAYGLTPAGLGARDTLRTEMGYPLHGQDLSAQISPVQARLGWAVGWQKPEFRGHEALRAERESGPRRTLRGLRALGRGIPRPGMSVFNPTGAEIGIVTSGTFSPTLKTGIALALLDSAYARGTVTVDIRGRRADFEITKPPFVTTSVD